MAAETALVELLRGRPDPTARRVLWQFLERAGLRPATPESPLRTPAAPARDD
ncbi:hypothetical protein [Amycolatopsis sp. DSM 110486]|uniref:hypothetical protein n=1 Tax=Amycolatopsis sp. DSM 110486 TaxID=2865832 RepID=UPI001C6A4EDB|nr:hypothetical protein [Amycolatopsis sp. DSM 110486]QYN19368.1 hypothetical protein K1T34_43240 [Amycolatopsis sp. DSM 110486]